MKQIYNAPKWLIQWNRHLAGETEETFEHVVPSGMQKSYKNADALSGFIKQVFEEVHIRPTIDQLYYCLVRQGDINHTTQAQSMLKKFVQLGLQWGLIDWDYITCESMVSVRESDCHPVQRWTADTYVEVWVEKPGFESILREVCGVHGVTWRVLRGRPSTSDIYGFVHEIDQHVTARILYLSDLDPVALATRTFIEEQLDIFADRDIKIEPIALTEQQITEHDLPANPVSVTAHGVQDYLDQYGTTQWELEALRPAELAPILTYGLNKYAAT